MTRHRAGRLWTVAEAARALRLHPQTVYAMIRRGGLPAVRFGRSVRVDPDRLREYVAGAQRQAAAARPSNGSRHVGTREAGACVDTSGSGADRGRSSSM